MGGGGKSGNDTNAAVLNNKYLKQMAGITTDLYNESSPMRQFLLNQGGQFLGMPQESLVQVGQPSENDPVYKSLEKKMANLMARTPTGAKAQARVQSKIDLIKQRMDELLPASTTQAAYNQTPSFSGYGTLIPESLSPVLRESKRATETAYQQGANNLIGQLGNRGALASGLGGLESARVGQMGSIYGNTAQDLYNKFFNYATGTSPQLTVGGLGNASGTYQNALNTYSGLENQNYLMNQSMQQAKGGGLGNMIGTGLTSNLTGSILGKIIGS